MKQCRIDMVTLLKASSAVAEIVDDRIYSGLAPLDSEMPFICIERTSTERPKTHDQCDNATRRKADKYDVTLFLVGLDIEELDDLHDAVDDALDGQATAEGTILFLFEGASESSEYVDDDSGAILYEIEMQFSTRRRPVS